MLKLSRQIISGLSNFSRRSSGLNLIPTWTGPDAVSKNIRRITSPVLSKSRILTGLVGGSAGYYVIDKYYSIPERDRVTYVALVNIGLRYFPAWVSGGGLDDGFHTYCGKELLALARRQGGVYVKIGQHLSSLPHLIAPQIALPLRELQTSCPEHSLEDVLHVINEDLGSEKFQYFTDFEPVPLGTASIAQVHKAKLNGRDVAIKVQHREIEEHLAEDLVLLSKCVKIAKSILGSRWNIQCVVDHIQTMLDGELDFRREARNAELTRQNHAHYPWLVVPKTHPDYTTRRVLVMDFEDGNAIDDAAWYAKHSIDKRRVINDITKLFNEMIITTGHLHSDPHPGNVKIRMTKRGDYEVVLLDHGQYTSLSQSFREAYCRFIHAVVEYGKDPQGNAGTLFKYGKSLNFRDELQCTQVACMILVVSWEQIANGGGLMEAGAKLTNDKSEAISVYDDVLSQEFVDSHLDDAIEIVRTIPDSLKTIMKTNSLIYSLGVKLAVSSRSENYIGMARLCLRTMRKHEMERRRYREFFRLLSCSIYYWFVQQYFIYKRLKKFHFQ